MKKKKNNKNELVDQEHFWHDSLKQIFYIHHVF